MQSVWKTTSQPRRGEPNFHIDIDDDVDDVIDDVVDLCVGICFGPSGDCAWWQVSSPLAWQVATWRLSVQTASLRHGPSSSGGVPEVDPTPPDQSREWSRAQGSTRHRVRTR
jgi:hypothetical protein